MECVFAVGTRVGNAIKPTGICFIVSEESLSPSLPVEVSFAQLVVDVQVLEMLRACIIRDDAEMCAAWVANADLRRSIRRISNAPGVAKPELRNDVQRSRVRTAVQCFDSDRQVFAGFFAVLDKHIKITLVIEDACVEKLEFGAFAGALLVLFP